MKSKGERIFSKCQMKNVESVTYGFNEGEGVANATEKLEKQNKSYNRVQYRAKLTCPNTKRSGNEIESSHVYDKKADAVLDLQNVAGAFACGTCEFAGLSQTAANRKLLELEKIDLEREQLKAERIEQARHNIEEVARLHEDFPLVVPDPNDRNLFGFLD